MEKSDSLIHRDLIEGKNFIIFGEDFARHPHALEHILRPMFHNNKFLWVETIGLRSPKLSMYDFWRIIEKCKSWISPNKNSTEEKIVPENIKILSPFMIPFNQFSIIRKFNQWMVLKTVRKALLMEKMENPITITSVPNACDYLGHFNESFTLYFCVDEFSLWPGLDKGLVARLEEKLIKKSDLIVATSDSLAKTKTKNNTPTEVITHGVDFQHFNIGPKTTKNEKLSICYFGLFDERSDQSVILEISNHFPKASIHIFGNIVCSIKKLKNQKNIIFHGPVAYQELPKAIAEMDIFILPYVKNELTHFINPLKLKEYLSSGRPVVASGLPEVKKLKEYLYVGETPEEFVQIIGRISKKEVVHDEQKVINYIINFETWQAKAELLTKIIKKNLKP